jgi:hypothetical protein
MYVSCYTYKSLWPAFLKLKEKYIDNHIKLYFCTDEIKNYNLNNNNLILLNFNQKSVFSLNGNLYERYLYYLNNIDSKYILFFYDDMLAIDYVSTEKIIKLMNIMDEDDNIKNIKLSTHSYTFNNGTPFVKNGIEFTKANNKLDQYLMNFQPILIRRDFFIDLIKYCAINNTLTHQNGGIEIYGTEYFRQNENFICLRVVEDVVVIQNAMGVVQSGVISNEIKNYLKEKENIEIETFENNLIYRLTNEEYNCLGDRLKEEYAKNNITVLD